MGVNIQTSSKIVAVSLSGKNEVQGVSLWRNDDQTTIDLACKQVLLACGPWTPSVYETLFPSSPLELHRTTDAGDWILCKNPCPISQDTTAFVSFASLVGEKLEFAARNDGTIWACGRRNFDANLPSPRHEDKPDAELIAELSGWAQKCLNWSCACAGKHAKFELLKKGRAFRPATKSSLPVISEVDSSDLIGSTQNESKGVRSSSGLFICWGHGSFGLTLGMGSGRLVGQLISGEEPDLDLAPFKVNHH